MVKQKASKNDVWQAFLDQKHNQIEGLTDNYMSITSSEVNNISKLLNGPDFRNLAKFDKREDLPKVFQEKELNILPLSNREFAIGHFNEYTNFNQKNTPNLSTFNVPSYDTLNTNIKKWNENSWINATSAVHAFDMAFEDEDLIHTLDGRMGSGKWLYEINSLRGKLINMTVNNAIIEIDSVFETKKAIYIIEAKRVKESNFLIRQLYFPYRKLISDFNIVQKPIIPVFYEIDSQTQLAKIRLFEFQNSDNYNSIREFKRFEFQFVDQNFEINTKSDFIIYSNTVQTVPTKSDLFPQANDLSKVLALLLDLNEKEMNVLEIALQFGFDVRQSDYYANVLVYFGFAKRNIYKKFTLTPSGNRLANQPQAEKNAMFARAIVRDHLFNTVFIASQKSNLTTNSVYQLMKQENMSLSEQTLRRRASTIINYVRWIDAQFI
ncbi:hypothetical protein AB3K25_06880 [Leuconostoc sp. MS02]|uniref:Translation elongation factor n=1 Tax=Leuconostoc aquikimchii TaxID=3236804 RepID=A0ABV3S1Q1_9LACO